VLQHYGEGTVALEREGAGEDLVEHDAGRVNVAEQIAALKARRSLSISEMIATGTRSTVVATRVNRSNTSSGGESRSDVRRGASSRASFSMMSTSLSFN